MTETGDGTPSERRSDSSSGQSSSPRNGDTALSAQQARRKLYEIIRRDEPFEQKARDALELGEQYLGADNGHLTRIDTETNHWEATISTDPPDGQFPPGLELDLGETYCRRTIAADDPVALHDAPAQGWDDDPAFEAHGLNCYHGTTLSIDDKPYGTVCFVAEDPRGEPFSNGETMFAELITRLLEREIERQHHQAELTRRTNLVNVLNRVLRHNLRNDMSVIRGHTQLMADQIQSDSFGETAIQKIDKLIDLSEKARKLEHIVGQDAERIQIDIATLAERIITDISADVPGASITLDAGEDVTAAVLPSFERALRELVENAAKHSGEAPTIRVTIENVPNAVEIRIADDGPGLSEQEREVLQTGVETPLVHGSGLGLWLVHWIVTSHDGSVEATVTDKGTTMTVSVPRSPATNEMQELAELRQARDQYEAAFEEAFEAQLILDDDARIIEGNPQAATILGLNRTELRGRLIPEFLPEEFDFEAVWADLQRSGSNRDTVTIEGADGVDRQVEYSATTDIVPGQHLVIARDITERVERERTLQQTSQRLKAIVAASPEPILAVNADGVIQLWNDAAERVFEYTAEEAVGTPIESLNLHSGQESEFAERLQRALAGERFRDLPVHRQAKSGQDIYLNISTAPLRNETGEITGVMAVGSDVTEQKRRQAELERYETVLQTISDSAWVFDEDKRVTFANQALVDQLQLPHEEIIGAPLAAFEDLFTDPDAYNSWKGLIDDVLAGDVTDGEMDIAFDLVDGKLVMNLNVAPVTDEHGPTGVVVIARDITERVEREHKLEQAETVFEHTQDAIFLIDVNEEREFHVNRVNEVYEEVTGLSNEEIQGKTPRAVVGDEIGCEIEAQYHECVERGETIEYREKIPVDGEMRTWKTKLTPVLDDGRVVKLVGAMRDVTEQKE